MPSGPWWIIPQPSASALGDLGRAAYPRTDSVCRGRRLAHPKNGIFTKHGKQAFQSKQSHSLLFTTLPKIRIMRPLLKTATSRRNPVIKVMSLVAMIFFSGTVHAYGRIEVSAEWDKSADFYHLKTYAWLPEPPERMQDRKINYLLLEPRVKGSVDIDLRHKGYEKVEGKNADFMIGYHVTKDEETNVAAINGFYGYAPSYDVWGRSIGDPGFSNTYVDRFVRGTLILDIVDPTSGKLIWRGYATAVIDPDSSLEDKTEIIQDATGQILQNFSSRVPA